MINKIRRKFAKIIYDNITFESYFNVPFKFVNSELKAVNEKIIEIPFVFSSINNIDRPQKILDFGCTRSWISISLASLGHNVFGVDLREYLFKHDNFLFKKQDILEFAEKNFDIVIAISTIEHVGLGVYGEKYNPDILPKIINKISSLLKDRGDLIVTTPVGKPSIDYFQRSFSPTEIIELIRNGSFDMEKESYFKRIKYKSWFQCTRNEIVEVSNHIKERNKVRSGVNGVGCFVFKKIS